MNKKDATSNIKTKQSLNTKISIHVQFKILKSGIILFDFYVLASVLLCPSEKVE